jgi:hypothetical protein
MINSGEADFWREGGIVPASPAHAVLVDRKRDGLPGTDLSLVWPRFSPRYGKNGCAVGWEGPLINKADEARFLSLLVFWHSFSLNPTRGPTFLTLTCQTVPTEIR